MEIQNPIIEPDFSPMDFVVWENIAMDFKPAIEKMFLVLLSHAPKRGLGWRGFDDLSFYLKRIKEEIAEFEKEPSADEAADIANFGLMLVYTMLQKEAV